MAPEEKIQESIMEDLYEEVIKIEKWPRSLEVCGHSNIYSLEETDKKKGYRLSIISADYNQPIKEDIQPSYRLY